MSKNNPYLLEIPQGYTVKQLSGRLNIIEFTDRHGNYQNSTIIRSLPKYCSSPLWKVINDKSEKTPELSQGRIGKSKGYNTETKESD